MKGQCPHNQITDKLTWQNPQMLEIEPWIATRWDHPRRRVLHALGLRTTVKADQ
ncbi:hypothetical protein [Nonomuraea sp. NEAU-A123]|uniref:hypothetical protein n=1 Tax=Nonomuraea sp. NEAU-A123 TaxID=2839649 RepID=UPI001BE49C9D|nr:hypothetical protein [Nonomuraea sp. NEAU-A123]MBT2225807.1 hypothetical protein [Nonomuraea sp. NEAU-A123]